MTNPAIVPDPSAVASDRRAIALDERSMRILELCLAGLAIAVVVALALLR